jgi:ribonucleoside-diphosphate reductase alpha chain
MRTASWWKLRTVCSAGSHGLDDGTLFEQLHRRGTLAEIPGIADSVKALFRTALEIPADDHLRVQAAFQRHVDNAVSKTVNLPESATPESIADVYRQAWEMGLKGVTVYRYGSRGQQVLHLGTGESVEQHESFARCDPDACRL